MRRRLGVDRGGGEADPVHRSTALKPVDALEDHALAQRPRADLELGRGRRCPCTASATRAPATIWWVRLGETPGRSASSSADIATSLGIQVAQLVERAAPAARAVRRPTARRRRCAPASGRSSTSRPRGAGVPARSRLPASWAISARIFLRSPLQLGVVGVAGEVGARQPGRAERKRPGDVRALVGAGGDLQRAAADVEDGEPPGRPAEPAADGQERQPGLVLTRQHPDVDAGALAHRAQHLVGVHGVAHRRGGERQHLLAALVVGDVERLGGEVDEGVDAGRRDRAVVVEVLGEPERLLVGEGRERRGAVVGVDHQQVAGVRADVEHAEPHGSTVPDGRRLVRRLVGCACARGRPGVPPCLRGVRRTPPTTPR